MFDRRVRIFLSILVLTTLVLLARVFHLQVLSKTHWDESAVKIMTMSELVETTRGRLLDRKGNPMAMDAPCIDAAVDYRAILFEGEAPTDGAPISLKTMRPEDKWVRGIAINRVKNRLGESYRGTPPSQREELITQETRTVRSDIRIMWEKLAEVGGMSPDEMDELRRAIIRKVDFRRRRVWYARYQQVMNKKPTTAPSSWYQRWLVDDSAEAPEVDQFFETIFEEEEAHVILPNITNPVHNYLGKNRDRFPGLVLRPSVHRTYPYYDVAPHVIGNLGRVARDDLRPDVNPTDERRSYQLNDLIGRSGLESLCESLLRGTRGKVERYFVDAPKEVRVSEPVPGQDVSITLDMDLQADIQQIFRRVELTYSDVADPEVVAMPGAAVVLDVKTNQVLALVSYPSYDLNLLDERYTEWARDDINRPMLNRATRFALEPGSTVKPIVGIGAITQGLFGVNETVECTGYLQLGGKTYLTHARCWVASMFGNQLPSVAHHPIPERAAHPTGFLTFADGLERSCNVVFETIGDRMGIEGLAHWYWKFGLGEPTGLGIAEAPGMLPGHKRTAVPLQRAATWFSAIGQDQVLATPIQMANVAATIARNGIKMRPRLLMDDSINPQTPADRGQDRKDLELSPQALAEAREGMVKVVNTLAGTGRSMHRDDMVVAGKTGSAQAPPMKLPIWDDARKKIIGWQSPMVLGSHTHPNPIAPWYRGWGPNEDRRSHAWVIGFAPAEDPKVAFAVMVEYGGGGGATAGWVAKHMLDACIDHGYLLKK